MTAALLDNPMWSALTTSQARFAESSGNARRFQPDVSILAGLKETTRACLDELAALTAPGQSVGVFFPDDLPLGEGWRVLRRAPLLQMILSPSAKLPEPAPGLIKLGPADVPEMTALCELTKPGPWAPRTRELGVYLGIREGGRLAAMTGERLRFPGYAEISAVCTHPEHLGRGHAKKLMTAVAAGMRARGETPFLHVLPGNERAIAVYETLGLSHRALMQYAILKRV